MDDLKKMIREVPDFPKKGILFYDITTLLKDKAGFRKVIDAVKPGARVVIADDLLATGGTSLASARLAEKLGGKVAAISFVIELETLKGRDRLTGYNVVSLLKY